jgi:hypothetical protein
MKSIIVFSVLTILSASLFAQIKNPDKPLKGKWDFQLKKVWEIEDVGDDVFAEVQNIRAAKDGRIYIADSKNCKIYIINNEGAFISSFGRRGEGPGEIMNYGSGGQLFVVNDTIVFAEWGKLQYFSLDGKYRKTVLIPSNLKPRTFISEDVFISAPATVGIDASGNKKANITLYNIKDQSKKVISEFQPYEKATASTEVNGRRATVSIVISSITPMVVINYRKGKIYYGMSDFYRINVVSLKGKEICSFHIDGRKRKDVSRAFKNDLARSLGDIPADVVKNIIDGLPKKASFFQGIKIDKNGLIYVLISDPGNETFLVIDIFSPLGKYLYSSELRPEQGRLIKWGDIYFDDDFLILTLEDEEGNLKVARYLIKLPVYQEQP